MMYVITKREIIKSVVERWGQTYRNNSYGEDKLEILERLKLLDLETVGAVTINNIIGNNSWTTLKCSECGKDSIVVIQVGEEPDYESATIQICLPCIDKLKQMAESL